MTRIEDLNAVKLVLLLVISLTKYLICAISQTYSTLIEQYVATPLQLLHTGSSSRATFISQICD